MEVTNENAGFFPTVKCSKCGFDVALYSMTNHVCSIPNSGYNAFSGQTNLPSPAESINGFPPREHSSMRSQRPLLPKIDSTAANRTQFYQGELTPASAGHAPIPSPMSLSSGRKSPWGASRRGESFAPQRSPSPELANLDCAFPPFPIAKTRSTTPLRDDKARKKGDENRSAMPRPATASRSAGPSRRTSTNTTSNYSSRPRSKSTAADNRYSRSSSATDNKMPSTHSAPGSRKQTVDEMPPIPQPRREIIESPILSESSRSPYSSSIAPKEPFDYNSPMFAEPESFQEEERKEYDGKFDHHRPVSMAISDSSSVYEDLTTDEPYEHGRDNGSRHTMERPSTVTNNLVQPGGPAPLSSKITQPTAPPPVATGGLGRSLTRLFNRKRSQTAASRRELVQEALSDDTIQLPTRPGPNLNAFERPRPVPEPNNSTGPPHSQSQLPSIQESPLANFELYNQPQHSLMDGENTMPSNLTKSTTELRGKLPFENISSSVPAHELDGTIEPKTRDFSVDRASPRESVDSVSSYGSIGYTEHSSSSRSSAPTEDLTRKPTKSLYNDILQSVEDQISATSNVKVGTKPADSPTDPLFQNGYLSPIPPVPLIPSMSSIRPDRTTSLNKNLSKPLESTDRAEHPKEGVSGRHKTKGYDKGVCRGCNQIITKAQKSVTSADGQLSGRYHKDCFACHTCKSVFPTAEFYVYANHPYCAHHYHELGNSLCATCGKGIEGLFMETSNAAGQGKGKHHAGCLRCTTCKMQLDSDYFELNGKVYCEKDAFRAASVPKIHNRTPARPSPLVREYISSGDPMMVAGRNFPERRTTRLMSTR